MRNYVQVIRVACVALFATLVMSSAADAQQFDQAQLQDNLSKADADLVGAPEPVTILVAGTCAGMGYAASRRRRRKAAEAESQTDQKLI